MRHDKLTEIQTPIMKLYSMSTSWIVKFRLINLFTLISALCYGLAFRLHAGGMFGHVFVCEYSSCRCSVMRQIGLCSIFGYPVNILTFIHHKFKIIFKNVITFYLKRAYFWTGPKNKDFYVIVSIWKLIKLIKYRIVLILSNHLSLKRFLSKYNTPFYR